MLKKYTLKVSKLAISLFLITLFIVGCGGSSGGGDDDPASNAITIVAANLNYRNYEDFSGEFRGYVSFEKGGGIITSNDITSISIQNSMGSELILDETRYNYESNYFNGFWDESISRLEVSGPKSNSGYIIKFPNAFILQQGEYTVVAKTNDGNTLTHKINYPGQMSLPIVEASSISYDWNVSGDLELDWDLPVSSTFEELVIWLGDNTSHDILYLTLPPTHQHIKIPKSVIDSINSEHSLAQVKCCIQTRNYDVYDMNYARGYSDTITIPWGSGSFGNNVFSGPWLLGGSNGQIYFIGDGLGNILEYSGIISIFGGVYPGTPGSYDIQSNGSFSCTFNTESTPISISGQLNTSVSGTLTGGNIGNVRKVSNLSGCLGQWSGTLSPDGQSPFAISLTVDSGGNIISGTGFTAPVQGKMFTDGVFVAAKFTTGDNSSEYNQISIEGGIIGNIISANFSTDAPGNPAGTVSLFR